jgi:hypothetical protein
VHTTKHDLLVTRRRVLQSAGGFLAAAAFPGPAFGEGASVSQLMTTSWLVSCKSC